MITRALVTLILAFTGANAFAGIEDSPLALELFRQKVHPIMYNSCNECHSERATYPIGPMHSLKNPAQAFPTFAKYINWENPEKSSLVMMAMNQHFCKEHQSQCNNANQISNNVRQAVLAYISEVKAAGVYQARPAASASRGKLRHYERLNPMSFEAESIIGDAEQPNIDVEALGVRFKIHLIKIGEDHYQIAGIYPRNSFRSGPTNSELNNFKYFAAQGLRILVNGKAVEGNLGFENLDRVIMMRADLTGQRHRLAIETPTIMARPQDKIWLSFDHFEELKEFPTVLCRNVSLLDRAHDMQGGNGAFGQFSVVEAFEANRILPQDRCNLIESYIDLARPRRSVLLDISRRKGGFIEENVRGALKFINDWRTLVNQEIYPASPK